MKSFGINELRAIVPAAIDQVQDCDPLVIKYRAWSKLDKSDFSSLTLEGNVDTSTALNQNQPNDYWSPDSVMKLSEYPYHGCQIYKHHSCNSYYFVYTEFGGHAPEQRCRAVFGNLLAP
jgi:hypothetical protein